MNQIVSELLISLRQTAKRCFLSCRAVQEGSTQNSGSFLSNVGFVVVLLASVLMWGLMSASVSYSDDEAIHYQPLACVAYPLSSVNTFRADCHALYLSIGGHWLPLRSFQYAGAASALFFAPVWWLIGHPVALKVWTGLLWFGNGLLMARILGISWWFVSLVVMFSIPVLAQHLIDTGPVSLQFLLIQLNVILALFVVSGGGVYRALYSGSVAGLLAFIAFEQKAFVVFALPFAGLLFVAGLSAATSRRNSMEIGQRPRASVWSICLRLGVFMCAFTAVATPLFQVLMSAKDRGGIPYGNYIRGSGDIYSLGRLSQWNAHFVELFTDYFVYPTAYFHRNFLVRPAVVGKDVAGLPVSQALVVALFVVAMLLLRNRMWRPLSFLAMSLILSLGDLFWIAKASRTWAGHHAIFAHVIVFVGLAIGAWAAFARHPKIIAAVIGWLLFTQAQIYWVIAHATPDDHADRSRGEMFAIVDQPEFAERHLVVHLSWGSYFIDSLFGPKTQAVIWVDNATDPGVPQLAEKLGRKLAFITIANPGWGTFATSHGYQRYASSSTGKWELWVSS